MNTWLAVLPWLMFAISIVGGIGLGLWIGIGVGYKVGLDAMQKAVSETHHLVPKHYPAQTPDPKK